MDQAASWTEKWTKLGCDRKTLTKLSSWTDMDQADFTSWVEDRDMDQLGCGQSDLDQARSWAVT
jgi:hypothetical protein